MSSVQTGEAVVCRPGRSRWGGPLLLLICGATLGLLPIIPDSSRKAPPDPFAIAVITGIGVLCMAAALVAAVWALRACAVADDWGLRWRGLGMWHSAAWDQVRDYYLRMVPRGRGGGLTPQVVVETVAGQLCLDQFWARWDALEDFQQALTRHAGAAAGGEWEWKGARLSDPWPRVFTYRTRAKLSEAVVLSGCLLAVIGYLLWMGWKVARSAPDVIGQLGWAMGAAALVTGALVVVVMGLYCALFIPTLRDYLSRLRQSITVSPDGIRFTDNGRDLAAPWSGIGDLRIERNWLERVYTATLGEHGSEIAFTAQLPEYVLLAHIIERFSGKQWQRAEDALDVLGGPGSTWTGGAEGIGDRFYHYRTRTSRALLWLAWTFPAAFGLVAFLSFHGLAANPDWRSLAAISAALAVAPLWLTWRYCAGGVRTDSTGLWQSTLRGRIFLAWSDVEEYGTSGGGILQFSCARGAGSTIRLYETAADVEGFREQVVRLSANARTREWGRLGGR